MVPRAMRATWAALPLRLMIGIAFVVHGYPKLFSATDHGQFVDLLRAVHVPWPAPAAWVVGLVEFVGGLALFLGIAVWLAAALNIVDMLVALFTVHLPHGFSFVNVVGHTRQGQPVFGMPGYEVNLLYIAGLLALILTGAGPLALGRVLWSRHHTSG